MREINKKVRQTKNCQGKSTLRAINSITYCNSSRNISLESVYGNSRTLQIQQTYCYQLLIANELFLYCDFVMCGVSPLWGPHNYHSCAARDILGFQIPRIAVDTVGKSIFRVGLFA